MEITERDTAIVLATFEEAKTAFEKRGIAEVIARLEALNLLVEEGRSPDDLTVSILTNCSGTPSSKAPKHLPKTIYKPRGNLFTLIEFNQQAPI